MTHGHKSLNPGTGRNSVGSISNDYSYLAMAEAMDRSARCRRERLAAGARCEDQGATAPSRDLTGRIGRARRPALDLPERSGARTPDADARSGQSRHTGPWRDAG